MGENISIHALREEGDQLPPLVVGVAGYFYPRPPRGGRLRPDAPNQGTRDFYPRPPRGGRLTILILYTDRCCISIHALREEGDANCPAFLVRSTDFYPRPPRGGRQLRSATLSSRSVFLSTPSARRATFANTVKQRVDFLISIHALREEGDTTNVLNCQ